MKKLNKKQKKQIAAVAAKKDADIDLTDMPEVLDWSKAEIGKFYRPAKKPVTIRLDTDIIAWLKSYGRGYQTKTNMLLRHAMRSSVRAKTEKLEKWGQSKSMEEDSQPAPFDKPNPKGMRHPRASRRVKGVTPAYPARYRISHFISACLAGGSRTPNCANTRDTWPRASGIHRTRGSTRLVW
jgi:uncharacterized protein (DUF4415 family)